MSHLGFVVAAVLFLDGAILAMGTVFSHNMLRHLDFIYPDFINSKNLLFAARLSTIPFTLASALIAAYYQSDHPAGATGYLLIVAFDVVLGTVVVPLFGCFYTKTPRPNAAFLSVLAGAITRIIMEFTLPKDGYLILPYGAAEFLDYGEGASDKLPTFVDAPAAEVWNPATEQCLQPRYEDYTGVDSLTAFLVSFLVFVSVQFLEHHLVRPLFSMAGLEPYEKKEQCSRGDDEKDDQSLGLNQGWRPFFQTNKVSLVVKVVIGS